MKYFLNFLILLFSAQVAAQPVAKVRTFGGPFNDYGAQLIQTSDGGYAIAGTTGSYTNGLSNMYLLKLNSNLEKEWSSVFGGENLEWGQSITETDDGFLILGYTNSFGAGGYDVYLVKCDFNGNLIWEQTYGGTDWDFGYKIHAANGGFYIAGETWSFSNGQADGYLLFVNSEGALIWSANQGGTEHDAFYDIFSGLNGVIAVGENNSESEVSEVFIAEVSPVNTVTEHTIGHETRWRFGRTGMLHSNGLYYVSGAEEDNDGFSNYLFLRLDENFNELDVSTNSYGGPGTEICYSISEANNNEVIMAGESDSYTGSVGAFLFRAEDFGYFISAPTFGYFNTDLARSSIVNSDGEYMFAGETNSFGSGNYDLYLVQFPDADIVNNYQLDEVFALDSILTNNEEIAASMTGNSLIYPNPATERIFLSPASNWTTAAFFDLTGKLIRRIAIRPGEETISLSGFSAGTYLIHLNNEEQSKTARLIIE
jgi:hypothetical protein